MGREKTGTFWKKAVCNIVVLGTVLFLAGCGKVNDVAAITMIPSSNTQNKTNITENQPADSVEETGNISTEVATTANGKQEIEDMTAMDGIRDMKIGWNLGNTLDSTRIDTTRVDAPYKFETAWGNPKVTQELIDAVLNAGFNVIRIPVSWANHIGPEPEYQITESWMERVKEVVDYAYNKGAYVIINAHHEDWNYPYYNNLERASVQMEAVWRQIAEVFQDYDEHLIFEGQNEPRKVGTSLEWNGGDAEGWEVVNRTNQVFVDTVRASGGFNPRRMLMIPGYAANCSVGIQQVKVPENDTRIIISVHAYEPYDFALNSNGRSTWNHDTTAIDKLMSDLKTLFIDKGTPVIIGEFAAINRDNESERAQWAMYYVHAAKEIGVPCIWWDNGIFEGDGERLGLFDRYTYTCQYPEILEALLNGIKPE